MKTFLECVPCFVRQTLQALHMATSDADVHERVMRDVLRQLSQIRFDDSPPAIGRAIHRTIRDATGIRDPYRKVKEASNKFALTLYPHLKMAVDCSPDPFSEAVRLAIWGNLLDFGVFNDVPFDEVTAFIEDALESDEAHPDADELREAVVQADDILYIGDNAGEIVFDRVLIEQLPTEKITFVTRGQPVINDVTREDAVATGIADLVEVIDNGSDAPGTILESCSPTFCDRFEQAGLVIAKGQGNYESLSDSEREVYFLLKAKCPVIARDLGCETGTIVVRRKPAEAPTDRATARC